MKARGAKRAARPAVTPAMTPALPAPAEVALPPSPAGEEDEEQAVMIDADGEGIESVADSADTAVAAFYQEEPEPEIAPEPELKPQPIPVAKPPPQVQPARPAAAQAQPQPVAQPQPQPQRPALDGPDKKPLQPHPPRKPFGGIGSKHGQPLKPDSTVRVNVNRVVKPRNPFVPRPQRDEK
jgi:hypothetical protein